MNAVRFDLGECSLGRVLVAASDVGLCAIFLGESEDALILDLKRRFGGVRLQEAKARLNPMLDQVIRFLENPESGLEVALDLRGTAFQKRVWEELRRIPSGETASYAEIARRIGQPKAARAVARACAENPLAVVVPCHRVVKRDGDLAGYRWGIERKWGLLQRERGAD